MTSREEITAERSGVYRMPPDANGLRERAAAARVSWLESDLARVRSKDDLLATLAATCGFAPSFGMNWDALADSLGDLSSRSGNGCVLRLLDTSMARRCLGADWSVFLDVLRAVAVDFRARRKCFIAFVDDAPLLAAWRWPKDEDRG